MLAISGLTSKNSTRKPSEDIKFLRVNKRQRMDKPETQAAWGTIHRTKKTKKHNT